MKSWSESFTHRADDRRRQLNRPCGFFMTDERDVPLNTPEGQALMQAYLRERLGK